MPILQSVRSLTFYLLLALMTVVWSSFGLIVGLLLPFPLRYRLINQAWAWQAIWLARWVAGVRYELSGRENIPARPCVILAKHQSTWETFYFSALFAPLSQVIKRELLRVPFWGWSMKLLKPIAIDRGNPKAALKQLASQGHERLTAGLWVLIFPEGTRVPYGQIGKFSRGGAALAVNAGLPVLPIAHNAGKCWPRDGWLKHPGTIRIVVGPPMYAEGSGPRAIAELNERAFAWVRQAQIDLGALPADAQAATGLPED
ncbi:lysophospholipid acyltransferase family protein [Pseudomonas sp. N040]|uniref:lysophospholipid acyltransferase family protein n=1 Tax=Pseudomonas sp. N040 TaxID=2785325 RepID=UPI0018A267A0|nr:lysophospholipid acyltransferase family protein [Pseudomonas sp. N040]MBF7728866.1 1-acyl-sn-glycerol-3-phosphate acyltransferase [Pseudomonas sp. N040]MBW7012506.1 1-acyl-sn-glycerol-3-phosphate acyltransferase [Pseudomonas sp. N040]